MLLRVTTRKNMNCNRQQEAARKILHVITSKSWTLEKYTWQNM